MVLSTFVVGAGRASVTPQLAPRSLPVRPSSFERVDTHRRLRRARCAGSVVLTRSPRFNGSSLPGGWRARRTLHIGGRGFSVAWPGLRRSLLGHRRTQFRCRVLRCVGGCSEQVAPTRPLDGQAGARQLLSRCRETFTLASEVSRGRSQISPRFPSRAMGTPTTTPMSHPSSGRPTRPER